MFGKRRVIAVAALVCAIAGTCAASAGAAQPVFYTKAAVGSTAPAVSFTLSSGPSFQETKSGTKITCKSATGGGEATGATTVAHVVIHFLGCETSGGSCGYSEPADEITTETLTGTIGNVAAGKPGLRLYSEAGGRGATFLTFTCVGGTIRLTFRGSIIGSLTGASGNSPAEGKLPAALKVAWALSKGIQKYRSFLPGEGEAGEEQLEENIGVGFEPAGISDASISLVSSPTGDLGVTL
jgi:hypothetical protein